MKKRVSIIALFMILIIGVGYLSQRIGRIYELNKIATIPILEKNKRFIASVKEGFGLERFYSQSGQDRWLVYGIYPDVKDGYYLDIGAADGIRGSNSKYIEDTGWKGVCIDPFPTNMEKRKCVLLKYVVDATKGKKIKFKVAGTTGGIIDYLNRHKDKEWMTEVPEVEFTTTTIDDILNEVKAPEFIHYMNLDIEGAELAALKGFSFSKHRIGAITLEHNYEEPKRTEIRKLLESKGYRLDRSFHQDDFYVLKDLPIKRP